jgi:hypothetical protein
VPAHDLAVIDACAGDHRPGQVGKVVEGPEGGYEGDLGGKRRCRGGDDGQRPAPRDPQQPDPAGVHPRQGGEGVEGRRDPLEVGAAERAGAQRQVGHQHRSSRPHQGAGQLHDLGIVPAERGGADDDDDARQAVAPRGKVQRGGSGGGGVAMAEVDRAHQRVVGGRRGEVKGRVRHRVQQQPRGDVVAVLGRQVDHGSGKRRGCQAEYNRPEPEPAPPPVTRRPATSHGQW